MTAIYSPHGVMKQNLQTLKKSRVAVSCQQGGGRGEGAHTLSLRAMTDILDQVRLDGHIYPHGVMKQNVQTAEKSGFAALLGGRAGKHTPCL